MAQNAGVESTPANRVPRGDPGARGQANAAGAARHVPAWPVLAFLGFMILNFATYFPSIQGPLISDDLGYLESPYTQSLDLESLAEMFDPFGDARFYTGNYAPLHLLLHALERYAFGEKALGYHLVNLVIHAFNAVLLAALLIQSNASLRASLLGATIFAVHPANVEAVAWISQLKTSGALALCLLALLAFGKRPAVATLCFVSALLVKASAGFVLPMAAALIWVRRGQLSQSRARWCWLSMWAVLFALYAVPQFTAFSHFSPYDGSAFRDHDVHLRTAAALGGRYLWMAATSAGVSAYHEPAPVRSWLDPWWLSAVVLGVLLSWRTLWSLKQRREQAAWWIGAAASFAPVSQVFPFLIPLADRYLYFILPGLIGGVILSGSELAGRHAGRRFVARTGISRASFGMSALIAVGVLALIFAVRSHERARLWRSDTLLLVDAAHNYPDGGTAHYLRARRSAREGDAETAVAALRIAVDRGLDRFDAIRRDPSFVSIQSAPAFRSLIFEMAGYWIERSHSGDSATQPELLALARAHLEREEFATAEDALERALVRGGPLEASVRSELRGLRSDKSAGRKR